MEQNTFSPRPPPSPTCAAVKWSQHGTDAASMAIKFNSFMKIHPWRVEVRWVEAVRRPIDQWPPIMNHLARTRAAQTRVPTHSGKDKKNYSNGYIMHEQIAHHHRCHRRQLQWVNIEPSVNVPAILRSLVACIDLPFHSAAITPQESHPHPHHHYRTEVHSIQ